MSSVAVVAHLYRALLALSLSLSLVVLLKYLAIHSVLA